MITFEKGMDPFSLEMKRDHVPIGFLQTHPGRDPQVILHDPKGGYLTRADLRQCEAKFKELFPADDAPREMAPPLPATPDVARGSGINPTDMQQPPGSPPQ